MSDLPRCAMEALHAFNLKSLIDTFVSLFVAFALGTLIGLERQVRNHTAGLRTNTLVAVAAAAFVDMGNRLEGAAGASHVAAYVVSGVGFLGAGAIMKEGANVRGLNTAATLWGSAAVGACAGADLIAEACVVALFVIAANTILRQATRAVAKKGEGPPPSRTSKRSLPAATDRASTPPPGGAAPRG